MGALGGVLFSALFTALIWFLGPRLEAVPLLPDQGASWYLWQLPEPTVLSRATAWTLYVLHQLAIWGLILYAQRRRPRYGSSLHPVNVAALAVNALFLLLHLLQSHVWYDGLAQDVSIFSSQGSVVLLLVWVLLMENNRRGLFFGRRAPIGQDVVRWARTYHGYLFSWATIYTLWYHPMVSTPGHLIGFFYMFLLLLQGSLFFTRAHLNRWWTVLLEVLVLVHGTLVAYAAGNGLWPTFAFGFGAVFVVTQLYGLGLPRWATLAVSGLYAALVAVVYSERGWDRLNEVLRIPAIEYLSVFALAAIIGLGFFLSRLVRGRTIRPHGQPSPAAGG